MFSISLRIEEDCFFYESRDKVDFIEKTEQLIIRIVDEAIESSLYRFGEEDNLQRLLKKTPQSRRRPFFQSFLIFDPNQKSYEIKNPNSDIKDYNIRVLRDFCKDGFSKKIRMTSVARAISWFVQSSLDWDLSIVLNSHSKDFRYMNSLERCRVKHEGKK